MSGVGSLYTGFTRVSKGKFCKTDSLVLRPLETILIVDHQRALATVRNIFVTGASFRGEWKADRGKKSARCFEKNHHNV